MNEENKYIAHKREDGKKQPVIDHLRGTSERASEFASEFGGEKDGKAAGMLHDIGKYSEAFQEYIQAPEGKAKVDHSTAGAQAADKYYLAGCAIAGHHGGLPDIGSPADSGAECTLLGRLKRDVEDCSAWKSEQETPEFCQPAFCGEKGKYQKLTNSFYIRMLFSCLVDADYLDTERFMKGDVERGDYSPLPELLQRLNKHYAEKWGEPKSDIAKWRCGIYSDCVTAGIERGRGLLTLTVPTGGGKTVASLAFALNHAVTHGMKRVIYVIPYTSIIDQTAKVFREILGDENVLEHHSGANYELDENSTPLQYKKALAAENWEAPVVVTTAVQFFESLYANKPSKCRKLHNVANSVIVFDEAQTLPTGCLTPCVAAIAQLVKYYGATAVLCTATQPALEKAFAEFGVSMSELCKNADELYTLFRRVTFKDIGTIEPEALAERLNGHERALCVVNSKKAAVQLFKGLTGEGCYCLTTLIYPERRKKLIEEIRQRLDEGLPCKVAATSLVEAGVDFDFPVVFRELAGIDSIIQAGGRCNRENKEGADKSWVYVFSFGEKAPAFIAQNVSAARSIMKEHADIAAREAVKAYFGFFRMLKGEEALDKYGVIKAFNGSGIRGRIMPFAIVGRDFKLIDENTVTIYIPLGEGAKLVEQLRRGDISRSLFRKLGAFGVSVYPGHFAALRDAGALELLETGDAILTDLSLYDEKTGLKLDPEGGKGHFH